MGISNKVCALILLLMTCIIPASSTEVPSVNAGLGSCSVDFTVEDSSHKPLYDAKIDVTIRYGFMSLRKTELEIGTNSDGKARVQGLPPSVKKPLQFRIRYGQQSKTIEYDPAVRCHADYTISLGAQ